MHGSSPNRRDFLKHAGVAGMALAGVPALAAAQNAAGDASPAAKPATKPATKPAAKPKVITKVAKSAKPLNIGIIGAAGRGTELAIGFAQSADAVVKTICDVDAKHLAASIKGVQQYQDATIGGVDDLRKVLDDPAIDAVAVATPDHWHAIAAILAVQAGKHVYVEKPCSHNPAEGEMLVAVARKHNKLVQHGTQRRSFPKIIEGIERVKSGEFGKVLLSRGWYMNTRPETGKRTPAQVPQGLNWDLWQGPAPRTEYTENVVHYKWHWFWHWGTGELGNNGVHALDVCRWGLGVDYPKRVTAGGGRYHFQDDQETPDTLSVTYDYGDKAIYWEGRSCHPRGFENSSYGIAFYGEKATVVIDGNGYRLLDPKGKEVTEKPITGPGGNQSHIENFVQSVLGKAKLNCDIEEGHKTTTMCHLGNIAYRTGSTVNCDPKNGHIIGNDAAAKLWTRDYDPKWAPNV